MRSGTLRRRPPRASALGSRLACAARPRSPPTAVRACAARLRSGRAAAVYRMSSRHRARRRARRGWRRAAHLGAGRELLARRRAGKRPACTPTGVGRRPRGDGRRQRLAKPVGERHLEPQVLRRAVDAVGRRPRAPHLLRLGLHVAALLAPRTVGLAKGAEPARAPAVVDEPLAVGRRGVGRIVLGHLQTERLKRLGALHVEGALDVALPRLQLRVVRKVARSVGRDPRALGLDRPLEWHVVQVRRLAPCRVDRHGRQRLRPCDARRRRRRHTAWCSPRRKGALAAMVAVLAVGRPRRRIHGAAPATLPRPSCIGMRLGLKPCSRAFDRPGLRLVCHALRPRPRARVQAAPACTAQWSWLRTPSGLVCDAVPPLGRRRRARISAQNGVRHVAVR